MAENALELAFLEMRIFRRVWARSFDDRLARIVRLDFDGRRRYSPKPEETPTNYPLISNWLDELNSGSRSNGHNFAQFGEFLHQNGYTRLYQLADEFHRENGPKELMELCPGMTLGLAKLLLKYAAKDCQKIKDHH